MIPYFQYNHIIVGPVVLQVWGIFVAAGIIAGVLLAIKYAKKYFLSEEALVDLAIWMLLSAFIFARLFHVVFYNLSSYMAEPSQLIRFWEGGMSSMGGFFGAFLAIYLFAKKRHFTLKEMWPYFDIMAIGLWLGLGIGRIGCFFIHDHKGSLSDFFLAINFSSGARHDLGFYESILGFTLFIVFSLLFKKLIKIRWGLTIVLSFSMYAVARFFLDFLRATDLPNSDARYANLTPAQWGMIAVVFGLTALYFSGRIRQKKSNGRIA